MGAMIFCEKRKDLEELRAETESIMSSGRAKAEASSKAEAARIRGMTGVEVAKLKAQSKKVTVSVVFTKLSGYL